MSYAATASAQRVRSAAEHGGYVAALGLAAAPVLAANGGYFPSSWGWAAAGFAWAAVLGSALAQAWRPSWLELSFVGGLAAVAGWAALSAFWTISQSDTALEVERTLVYVAAALAVVTVVRAAHVPQLTAGVCTGLGLVCLYALASRLFPHATGGSEFAGSRLATPIGYWNGLGLVAGMGALLALVFGARAAHTWSRVVASASVPIFLVTLYFTFGRGAWIALLAALAVLFAVSQRRLQLLGTSLPTLVLAAIGVWRASREHALTHTTGVALQTASHEGRGLAALVAGLCLVAAYAAYGTSRLDGIWVRPSVVRPARIAILVAVVVVVAAVVARFGSPVTIARHGYDSFTASPTATSNLNSRLFSLSNNGRVAAWKVAWQAFKEHPVAGLGAGGFEPYWNQHRRSDLIIHDAHNLYLETLAEGGIVGFVLLMGTLLLPFVALRRARQSPFAVAATAAYAMYLVHAIADWDWELAGVTLTAVLCAGAVLAAARGETAAEARTWPGLAFGSCVAVLALVGLAGNLLVTASERALRHGNAHAAASDAHRATRFAPWSANAWQRLAQAQLSLGKRPAALASFRNAIARDPQESQRWIDLAIAARGQARAAALDRAHALDPWDPSVAVIRRQLGSK